MLDNHELSDFEIMPSGAPEEKPDYKKYADKELKKAKKNEHFDFDYTPKDFFGKKESLYTYESLAKNEDFEDLPGYVFLGVAWYDLSKVDLIYLKQLNEDDCARKGDTKQRAETIANHIENTGFDGSTGLPCLKSDGRFVIQGRGRIRGLKEHCGQERCPVFVYAPIPTEGMNEADKRQIEYDQFVAINSGQQGKQLVNPLNFETIKSQVVSGIQKNIISNLEECEAYLKAIEASKTLSNSQQGQVWNQAVKAASSKNSSLRWRELEDVQKWVESQHGVDHGYHLHNFYQAVSYAERLWCRHIEPRICQILKGEEVEPLEIIGYTTGYDYDKEKSNAKTTIDWLNSKWEMQCETVRWALEKASNGFQTIEKKLPQPYKFIGFIPQVSEKHEDELITNVADY